MRAAARPPFFTPRLPFGAAVFPLLVHIEKLELQGFKTFVQHTNLEFPQPRGGKKRGLAAIVGPNGSGKSNIVDAIRWVTGEQSLKKLRGKKSEDIIFSGTDKRSRVGLAEVSLWLNNEDRQAPVDYSQIVITRRLNRSGESEYLLNDHVVRLQDITMLLAQASVGQKTYSIVGQGMVDAVLAANPAERKEFFDEAAGTRHLQIKREEAVRRLVQAEENLHQGQALIQEIEPRLRSLTRQVRRLERRDEVAAELRHTAERYYGGLLAELNNGLKREAEALKELSGRRSKAETELNGMEQQFATMERATPSSERFAALTAEHRQLWEARAILRERIVTAKTASAAAASSARSANAIPRARLLPEFQELEAAVDTLVNTLAKGGDVVAIVRSSIDGIVKHLRTLRELVGRDEIDQTKLDEQFAAMSAEERVLESKLADAERRMQTFQAGEEEKNKAFFALQRSVQAKQQEVTTLLNAEGERRVAVARLQASCESLEATAREELATDTPPSGQPLSPAERDDLKRNLEDLKRQVAVIGTIDPETVEEYRTSKERYDFLTTQASDLEKSIHDLRRVIQELDETISKQFHDAFQKISHHFEHFFKILFGGGLAKLIKVTDDAPSLESEDTEGSEGAEGDEAPVSGLAHAERIGIEIHATPPGKRLKSINMLSGGERALTALALICAIIATNPPPFVVFDEVEAALDEANSARFAEIIDQLSHRTQFIIITHNRATMHQANILYGVTMGEDGTSKILSLKLEDIKDKE